MYSAPKYLSSPTINYRSRKNSFSSEVVWPKIIGPYTFPDGQCANDIIMDRRRRCSRSSTVRREGLRRLKTD